MSGPLFCEVAGCQNDLAQYSERRCSTHGGGQPKLPPDADHTGKGDKGMSAAIKCPTEGCDGENIRHMEDVSVHRKVTDPAKGVVASLYEAIDDEGTNERFWCIDCDAEWPVPDKGQGITWV